MASRILSKAPRFLTQRPKGLSGVRFASSVPNHLLQVPQTKVSLLSNGIRVATEEWPGEIASVGVYIGAGSSFENEYNNGVAHFLEHMAFKGTTTRKQAQLELEIENMGAQLNAYTAREQTAYTAKAFKKDVNKSLDILGDILQNSTFDKDKVEQERGTILREMQEVENNTEEAIFDYLHAAGFQGTSLGRPILGSVENVQSITRNDLVEYINTYYTAPHIVVAAAGAVKHEEVVAQAEKVFSKIPSSTTRANIRDVRTEFTGSEIRIRNDDHPIAHVAIGVEGVGWTHPDHFVLLVIQTMLGNWDKTVGGGANLSSRLCEIVAGENLVHHLTSFYTAYGNTALFGNHITAEPHKVEDAVYEVLYEWQRIGHASNEKEVERAKAKLRASSLMQLDGSTAIADNIGRQMLSVGRVLSPAEIYLRVNDVTVADVRRVAQAYLNDVSPAVVSTGPIKFMPDYDMVRGWTYWNRM
jgi:processing peptidase subunit beta